MGKILWNILKYSLYLVVIIAAWIIISQVTLKKNPEEVAFQKFVKDFNRNYKTQEEHDNRFKIFKENFAKIKEEHAKNPEALFDVNKFADLTEAERKRYLGFDNKNLAKSTEAAKFQHYDVIVVGLGCAGLSTTYYAGKQGVSVLGFDMNKTPGAEGTSSSGHTRVWFGSPGSVKDKMMQESLDLWRELSKDLNETLLELKSRVVFGSQNNPEFVEELKHIHPGSHLLYNEIQGMFSKFRKIPEDYRGWISHEVGIIYSEKTLAKLVSHLDTKFPNVTLKFDSKVTKVGKHSVVTEDGTVYYAKNVVVTTGAYTGEIFDQDNISTRKEIITHEFNDTTGLPLIFKEVDENGNTFIGQLDGPKLDRYKLYSTSDKNTTEVMAYVQKRMPTMVKGLVNTGICVSNEIVSETEQGYQYRIDDNGVHYGFGLSSSGFKFLPLHGKIIYDGLIQKKYDRVNLEKYFE